MEGVEEFMDDQSTLHGWRKQTGVCYEVGLRSINARETAAGSASIRKWLSLERRRTGHPSRSARPAGVVGGTELQVGGRRLAGPPSGDRDRLGKEVKWPRPQFIKQLLANPGVGHQGGQFGVGPVGKAPAGGQQLAELVGKVGSLAFHHLDV